MYDKNYIIQLIKFSVLAAEPNATIVLYGSYARGDNRDDSDINLLILVDNDTVTGSDERRITYPLYDIEFETGILIGPLVLSKKDWESRHRIIPFYENVTKERKVL